MTLAPAATLDLSSARTMPSTSLSIMVATTIVTGPAGDAGQGDRTTTDEEGPEIVECGREHRGPGGVVGAIEQHLAPARGAIDLEELKAAWPACLAEARAPVLATDVGDSRVVEGVENRVRHGCVGCLVATAQADGRRAGRCEVHRQSIPADRHDRSRTDLRERGADTPCAAPYDLERLALGARDGEVAALDDRGLLSRDGRDRRPESIGVVERDVRDRGHAAVPGMRRVESPAKPDFDDGDVDPFIGEPSEDHRREELELRRLAEPPCDTVCDGQCLLDEPGERRSIDGPAVDDHPLAVADQMRLRRLADAVAGRPKRGCGEREDAALAVRSADEHAAQLALGVAQGSQERPRPAETEPNAEPPPILQRTQRVAVGEMPGCAHVSASSARPRRRRTG